MDLPNSIHNNTLFTYLTFIAQSGGKETNVMFQEEPDEQVVNIGSMPRESPGVDAALNLTDFFKRPVKIHEFDWAQTVVADTIYPWDLFFSNPRISNRINNYRLFRGKLHIKVMINGSPFFYGKCIACYRPSFNFYANAPPGSSVNVVRLSQLPYISIDPTTSRGGDIIAPFFYYFDWFSVTQSSTEYQRLGALVFQEINTLSNTQSAPADWSSVPVTVFAWMEEIEVKGITKEPIGMLTAQSGEEEQTTSKPVSQVATSIAAAAGALKTMPVISPYATAVQAAANGVASAARALGYCRPTVVEEPQGFIHRALDSMAATNTSDSSVPLSLDVKNSLTLDPATVGLLPNDELSLKYLCSIESYIVSTSWPISSQYGTILRAFAVRPTHLRLSGTKKYYTSVGGWSTFFKNWTGSLVFRVEVVANAMHRGRLGVYYDPSDTAVQQLESNVQLLHVLDLDKCRTVEITIPIQQEQTWLDVDDSSSLGFGTASLPIIPGGDNGSLVIAPITPLTVSSYDPSFDSDAYVNVYIKGGTDFQLANPTSTFMKVEEPVPAQYAGYKLTAQSGMDDKEMLECMDSALNPAGSTSPQTNLSYMGEAVNSFRQILKRYTPIYTFRCLSSSAGRRQMYTIPFYPAPPAQMMIIPYHSDSAANPVTYSTLTPDMFVRSAFQGHRGSMRYKWIPWANNSSHLHGATMAFRNDPGVPYGITDLPGYSGGTLSDVAYNLIQMADFRSELLGSHATHTSVNPVLEVQIPFYSKFKFLGETLRVPSQAPNTLTFCVPRGVANTGSDGDNFSVWVACGEDFTAFYYCGFPVIDDWAIPAA